MSKSQSLNPYYRFIVIWLLIAAVLILSACSTSGWFGPPRPEDLAKIYVELPPFKKTTLLPNQHRDAPLILAKAMQGQLREENRLQLDSSIHSLSIKNIILVHQSATLIAQAELFDDGELLQFSRVVRHLEANDDWMQAMEWVAELLLRELLEKLQQATLSSSRYTHYSAYYGNSDYPPFYRRQRNNPWLRPSKSMHPISSSALPNPPQQPQPKEHQASSAIVKALPKSHKTPRIAVQKPLDTAVDVSSDTGVIDIPRDSIYMPPVSYPAAGEASAPLENDNTSPHTSTADNPSTSPEASSVGANTNNTLDTNSGETGAEASPVQGEATNAGDPSPSSSESGGYANPSGSASSSASESGSYSSPSESTSPSSSESGSYSSPSESDSPSSSESGSYSSPSESASPSSSESGSYSSPSESVSPSSGSHASPSESVSSSSSGPSSESHQSASSSQQTSAPPTPEPSPPPPPPAPKPDPKPEPKTDNSTTEGSADTASP
ncbi:MAG: hypothetical protein NTV43_02650 [Methylococcales bacterium]|nr:hypothetical protein [Methylococcales bacterium]